VKNKQFSEKNLKVFDIFEHRIKTFWLMGEFEEKALTEGLIYGKIIFGLAVFKPIF